MKDKCCEKCEVIETYNERYCNDNLCICHAKEATTPEPVESWKLEAARTALEASKLTKHYALFSERIYQGFERAVASQKQKQIEEVCEMLEGMKRDTGFLYDKARNNILDDIISKLKGAWNTN